MVRREGTFFEAVQHEYGLEAKVEIVLQRTLEVFPALRQRRRAEVTINIGQPFRPLRLENERDHRAQLDEMGHQIMRHIAELIPPEKRGHYSNDPAIREAAKGTEIYPWADKIEGKVKGMIH